MSLLLTESNAFLKSMNVMLGGSWPSHVGCNHLFCSTGFYYRPWQLWTSGMFPSVTSRLFWHWCDDICDPLVWAKPSRAYFCAETMDHIHYCMTATPGCFCGNSTIKICCFAALHLFDGPFCLLACRRIHIDISRPCSAGCGRSSRVELSSLLSRELKYCLHSSSSSSSLEGVVPSLILTLGLGLLFFSELS